MQQRLRRRMMRKQGLAFFLKHRQCRMETSFGRKDELRAILCDWFNACIASIAYSTTSNSSSVC